MPPFSAFSDAGTKARSKPSLAASFNRSAPWATGRSSPDKATSPNATASAGTGRSDKAETKAAATGARSQLKLMQILRDMKLEAALLIALADIGGVWGPSQFTQALTQLADAAVALSVNHLLREAMRQKKIASAKPDDPQSGSGYIVLAMGKMGAGELNFSSDIDLMIFFDASARLGNDIEPAPFFIALTVVPSAVDLTSLICE